MLTATQKAPRTVYAMNGMCPIPLEEGIGEPTDADLFDWFHRVREWGLQHGKYLTRDAIILWGDTLYPPCDEEWEYIAERLEHLIPEDEP